MYGSKNSDLEKYAATGKMLFFDCPGFDYEDRWTPEDYKYFKEGEKLPEIKNSLEWQHGKLVELYKVENEAKRTVHPGWQNIIRSIYACGKQNVINTCLEGGKRIDRRFANILLAFTYGVKLKHDDLDDPDFEEKLRVYMSKK